MYAELQISSNFSFLAGASHPHEIVWRAAQLGYRYISITDANTLSSAVRAHAAAKDAGIRCLVGCRIEVETINDLTQSQNSEYVRTSLLIYPKDREGYGKLCRLLTEGRARVGKNDFLFSLGEFLPYQKHFVTIVVP
jgi:error-prone DNA polymerase